MIGTVLFTVWHPEWDFKSTHSICLCKNVKGSISFSVWMPQSDNGAQGLLWSRPCQLDHGISVLILVTLTSSFLFLDYDRHWLPHYLWLFLLPVLLPHPLNCSNVFPLDYPASRSTLSHECLLPLQHLYLTDWHTPFLTHLMLFPLRTKQEPRKTFPPQLSQKLHVCLLNIVFMLPWASFFLPPPKKTLNFDCLNILGLDTCVYMKITRKRNRE